MKTFGKTLAGMAILVIVAMTSCINQEAESSKGEVSSGKSMQSNAAGNDIHTAAYLGDLNSIRQHIRAGANLDEKNQNGGTALIIAIIFDKTDVAKALIEGGADLAVANNEGATPLHVAAFFCRPELVEVLLNNGADKALRNQYGSTALETVAGPFEEIRSVYDAIGGSLKPLGLDLDYAYIEATRPQIAEMLRAG